MSAFVVSHDHIDALLSFAMQRYSYGPVSYFIKDTRRRVDITGCFVTLSKNGIEIEYGRTAPKEEKAGSAKKSAALIAEEKKKANRKPEDSIPANLLERLAGQLTKSVSTTLDKQPNVALAALLAGFASGDQACTVRAGTYSTGRSPASFATAFAAALKLSIADQVKALAKVAASAVNFVRHNSKNAALEDGSFKALCEAIDGKTFNAAAREAFDAKDYFASASRKTIVAAVAEAMGSDHASKVEKMDKPTAVKFAHANLPKLKWLPKQLRVSGYDGPKAKAVAKAKPAKKAVKKTAKRK